MKVFHRSTERGKVVAPVVDVFPHLMVGFHDEARVDEEMRLFRTLGFERVYFVLCNPGYPMFSNPALSLLPAGYPGLENYAERSIAALGGEPDAAYARACRRHGMEAFAIIKPYEGGGGATVPHGARKAGTGGTVRCLGGDRIGFDALLAKRPELRVMRRPEPEVEARAGLPVAAAEVAFCAEPVEGELTAADVAAMAAGAAGWELWTSADNGIYARHEGALRVAEREEERVWRDANGRALDAQKRRTRVVRIEGFEIDAAVSYLAIVREGGGRRVTLPQSMVRLFGPEGEELPCTVSVFVRSPGNPLEATKPVAERVWGMENQPSIPADAAEARERLADGWGFEHEWYGSGFWGPGWRDAVAMGVARGKLGWMKGTPCEAYPEVREYWLEWVERCIAAGFDGVDVRLQNHSGMVSDYEAYGFNPPLVEAYRERHGIDILKERPDPLELMALRGECFMEFLEAAAARLKGAGRKLQVHLRHCHESPRLSAEFNELGFWAMPKVWLRDWKRVVDLANEITLKDYYFRDYRPGRAAGIKARAVEQGKRVWIHCYISQAQELREDFFRAIEEDSTAGGVLLYEVAHSLKNEVNHGLIEQYGPVGLHEPTAAKLREILGGLGWAER